MAFGGTSYMDWMRQNPELVSGAQQRYGQSAPAQPAAEAEATPQAQPVMQPAAQAAPRQATDSERVPMMKQQGLQSSEVQPPQRTPAIGSGAKGGSATVASQNGTDGAKSLAATIASFWTGGAASAIAGMAGGNNNQSSQMAKTYEEGADQKGSKGGGLGLGDVLSAYSAFKGGGK